MKNILVVCPLLRDRRELSNLKHAEYNYIFFEHRGDELLKLKSENSPHSSNKLPHYRDIIKRLIDEVKDIKIDGVMSTGDYPGSLIASLVAEYLGLVGPDIENLLRLQHKFLSRLLQKEIVPEATPVFSFINDSLEYEGHFPVFIKPVKSSFSRYAGVVQNHFDLSQHVLNNQSPLEYLSLFNELFADFSNTLIKSSDFLVEGLLQGQQVSLEGFVSDFGVEVVGIVDSHMYPETMSFMRFEYPSALPKGVQEKMKNIAKKVIYHSGLKNTFFNIEFIYNSENQNVSIIEINPRLASQFADLFEKVDGENGYSLLTQIALGERPSFKQGAGNFKVAASCALRIFHDALVERVPTAQEINAIVKNFPGTQIEICCQKGEKLSKSLQDGQSFRYALVHLGAQSSSELLTKLEEVKSLLNFSFRID